MATTYKLIQCTLEMPFERDKGIRQLRAIRKPISCPLKLDLVLRNTEELAARDKGVEITKGQIMLSLQ